MPIEIKLLAPEGPEALQIRDRIAALPDQKVLLDKQDLKL